MSEFSRLRESLSPQHLELFDLLWDSAWRYERADDMAQDLQISTHAVHQRIRRLRKVLRRSTGLCIEAKQGWGYRLIARGKD